MSTWVVVGGGPSVTAADVAHALARAPVLAVNSSYAVAPGARVVYGCDGEFWDEHIAAVPRAADRWTQDERAANVYGLRRTTVTHGAGFATAAPLLTCAGNGGAQAVQLLAAYYGARRVLLLGFDAKRDDAGRLHHHPDHKGRCWNPDEARLAKWADAMQDFARGAREAGVEIVNCSPSTAIKALPRAALREVL